MKKVKNKKKSKARSYSAEYKADAVALVIDDDRSVADVARSLGIAGQTLWRWVDQARKDRGDRPGLTTDDLKRVSELERENRRLKDECELLKRAAAFFAKESQQ